MLNKPSKPEDALRQSKDMTADIRLDSDLDFLNLREVAAVLRVAPVSIYRLIAKRALPVYRTCRKVLFKKSDVLDYLEQHRKDPADYGSPQS